ncbi:MAG TPA: hypothetical protein VI566_00255 [Xanthomonadales bacterium]|nr:hypothetical protein [Xanthomonadales bacterium]
MENLGTLVVAVGALGTASFGIVEAFKWAWIGILGFGQIEKQLGAPVLGALRLAYGPGYLMFLKAQYRAGRGGSELRKTIRQGARVGLTPSTAKSLADYLGVVDPDRLAHVAELVQSGQELTDEQRGLLGRYELALDARIDAALALANERYVGCVRIHASVISIGIALWVGFVQGVDLKMALLIGVAAVPVAPIVKDLTSAIQAASNAMKAGK